MNYDCDSVCNVKECYYDYGVCQCAPGCSTVYSGQCDPACLVLSCDYDHYLQSDGCTNDLTVQFSLYVGITMGNFSYVPKLDYCSESCPVLDLLTAYENDGECQGNCNTPECAYSMGLCTKNIDAKCSEGWGLNNGQCFKCSPPYMQFYGYCVDVCPRGTQAYTVFPQLCVPKTDTSTADTPDVLYVLEDWSKSVFNDGDVYYNLMDALAAAWAKYTVIYLLGPTVAYRANYMYSFYMYSFLLNVEYKKHKKFPDLIADATWTYMTIQSYPCSLGNMEGCYDGATTLQIYPSAISIPKDKTLEIKDVLITTRQLFAYTADTYCPILIEKDGKFTNDRGETVLSVHDSAFLCKNYQDITLFKALPGGVLTLTNIVIQDVTIQLQAVIAVEGGDVTLNNVVFSNVQPGTTSNTQAVILNIKDCDVFTACGSLTYHTGTVEYINNGYEITQSTRLNPFLKVTSLTSISIQDVSFRYNQIQTISDEFGFITLKNFLTFSLTSCLIDTNVFLTRFIDIQPALFVTSDRKKDPFWYEKTHIQISKVTIRKTTGGSQFIYILQKGILQNVAISDCDFSDISLLFGDLMHIEYVGTMDTKTTTAFLNIERTSFRNITSYQYLISIKQMVNVKIEDTSFVSNGDIPGKSLAVTMQYYLNAPQIYAKMPFSQIDPAECQSQVSLSSILNTTLHNITLSSNTCTTGSTGFDFLSCPGKHTISDFNIVKNTANGDFIGLRIQNGMNLNAENVQAKGNVGANGGVVYVGTNSNLTLGNAAFEDNKAYSGTCIYLLNGRNLKITDTSFLRNSAESGNGGGIFYYPILTPSSQFTLTRCTFDSNTASNAGAIGINQGSGGSAMEFILQDSVFMKNKVTGAGSSFLSNPSVTFTQGSRMEGCVFKQEVSSMGVIGMVYLAGWMTIRQTLFEDCVGDPVAVLNLQVGGVAVTTMDRVTVTGAKGGAVIRKANALLYAFLSTINCVFLRNSITSLYFEGGEWRDVASVFQHNTEGPVVLKASASANLTNTKFESNISPDPACYAAESALNCTGCVFRSNVGVYGAALAFEQSSGVRLVDCLFEGNNATGYASAISAQTTNSTPTYISNTVFRNNDSPMYLMLLFNARMYLTSVLIEHNTASQSSPSLTTLQSSLFITNLTCHHQTGTQSPFIFIQPGCTVVISNSLFYSGEGTESGAISLSTSSLTVTNTVFHTLSVSEGSAVLYVSTTGTISFTSVTAYNLHSDGITSAIEMYSSPFLSISESNFHNFDETAVQISNVNQVNIRKTVFALGVGEYGGGFSCYTCGNVVISDCTFEKLNATYGGATYFSMSGNSVVSSSVFEGNIAGTGGGIFAEDTELMIKNSDFKGNSATNSDGGGVFSSCPSQKTCKYQVQISKFEDNYASVSGGALAWKTANPELVNLTTVKNTAFYGANFASFPTHLTIQTSRLLQGSLDSLPPGQPSGVSITAVLTDHYGQRVLTDNSSIANLEATGSSASVSGTTKATAINGIFTFTDFSIFADPLGNVTLTVATPDISGSTDFDSSTHRNAIKLDVRMRDCIPGESTAKQSCNPCASRTYGFDPSKPCQNCLKNAQCLGTTQMYPDAGYWRSGIYSETVWLCPLPSSCLGGDPFDNHSISWTGYCATGYSRNMCESCAWGYSRSGKDKCGSCPPIKINIVRIVFVLVAMVLYNAYQIFATLKNATKPTAIHSIYLKILTNYLQLVFLVTEFRLSWPKPVLEIFSAQESSGGVTEQLYSIDCFLSNNGDSSTIFYKKMIFMAVLPAAVAVAIIFFWVFMAAKTGKMQYIHRELSASLVIAFFFIHPTLTKALFSMFSCTEIDPNEYWLTIDMAIKCYNSEHILYLLVVGIPAIVVWVFAVPLVCLAVLVKNRRSLDELWLRLQYGFLISGYSRSRFYWEFVVTFRKIAVICCSVFFTSSATIQALTVEAVLIAFFLLQLLICPYTLPELNSMELKGILVACITIYAGLYYLTESLSDISSWFFFILVVAANAVFIFYWVVGFLGYMIDIVAVAVPCIGHIIRPRVFEKDPYIEMFLSDLSRYRPRIAYAPFKDMRTAKDMHRALIQDRCVSSTLPPMDQPSYIPTKNMIRDSEIGSNESADIPGERSLFQS